MKQDKTTTPGPTISCRNGPLRGQEFEISEKFRILGNDFRLGVLPSYQYRLLYASDGKPYFTYVGPRIRNPSQRLRVFLGKNYDDYKRIASIGTVFGIPVGSLSKSDLLATMGMLQADNPDAAAHR